MISIQMILTVPNTTRIGAAVAYFPILLVIFCCNCVLFLSNMNIPGKCLSVISSSSDDW